MRSPPTLRSPTNLTHHISCLELGLHEHAVVGNLPPLGLFASARFLRRHAPHHCAQVGDASTALDFSVFVDLVVSVVDVVTNKQYSTRFFGQMPLVPGGVLLHCEHAHASAFLSEVSAFQVE
jgi:hypothetical protein